MKSLAKALIIIACLGGACWMTLTEHAEMGIGFIVMAIIFAVFYEAKWQ